MTTADDRVSPADDGAPSTREYFPDDADKRVGQKVWFDEPNAPDAQTGEGALSPGAEPEPTVVIEDGVIGKRLRRPMDLVRLLIALLIMAAIAALAFFATSTTTGLGADL